MDITPDRSRGLDFCPTLRELYAATSVSGRSGRQFSALSGLSTRNNIDVVRKLLLEHRPSKTLEVGMACGGSTLTFASTLRDLGQAPNRQHIAIDAWQSDGYDDVGR